MMKKSCPSVVFGFTFFSLMLFSAIGAGAGPDENIVAHASAEEPRPWSDTVNGLQARLTLVEKEPTNGIRWLVPYLELRNVRDLMNPMEVDCSRDHLKVELVNEDGVVLRSGWALRRSGPAPELPTVTLPFDSSMRISLECNNWGSGRAAAMVQTDSGAWDISDEENGKVFLRATLIGDKSKPEWKRWYGELRTQLIPVEWHKDNKQ